MKRLVLWLLGGCVAGCVDDAPAPWSLAQERIVAVRAEPPGITEGQTATLTALVSHVAAPVTEEQPVAVSVVSPRELFTAVHYNVDHWQIDAPAVPAPTPLVVEMRLTDGAIATRTVWLGVARANPPALAVAVPDPVSLHHDRTLPDGEWLTSCGALRGSVWRVDRPCDGQLVGVARDAEAGVTWTVIDVHAR